MTRPFRIASGSAHYLLSCPGCGAAGAAEQWLSGWSLTGRQAWALNASFNFICGPESIRGWPLICRACGAVATTTTVTYQQFFTRECPEIRPVAGSDCGPCPASQHAVEPANGDLFPNLLA